jgi:L-ascorbate metabolism protein UlaG (beta-lactamase superfamily)
MRITWLGHSTVLLEREGARLITDPVLRDRVGPLVRIAGAPDKRALGDIDAVLLSHLHADHADPPSLRSLGRGVKVVAPRLATPWLRRVGYEDVTELGAGEETEIAKVHVRATPASHDGRRQPLGPRAEAIGYTIGRSASVYYAGDTDLFPEMAGLCGSVSVALVPVWGWGPSLGPGHLDPERAARAVALISPRVAIPVHWGTLALGWPAKRPADPQWPAREFARLTARSAPHVEVRLLAPGEATEL